MCLHRGDPESSKQISPDVYLPFLLVSAGILFFADPLFSSKNFYFRDILNFHYPLRRYLIETLSHWELPLWNPALFFGQPMLANPNYMAAYPTTLLHLFLPFNYAFKLHFILQPLLGGLGAYFLQRRLGIAPIAAFGGSLSYQFSGTVLSFLNLYNIVPAVALLPWIGWSFYGALHQRTWGRYLTLGMILGLQIIAGEPVMIQCVCLLMAGLGLLFVYQSQNRRVAAGVSLGVGFLGFIYGVLVAGVQVIPSAELMPLTARAGGYLYESVSTWSMHPMDWANLAVPNLFGSMFTIDLATYWGELYHNSRGAYLASYFAGSVVLLLAVISFISPRKAQKWTFAAILLVGCTLALGDHIPLHRWLFEHVPGFALGRYPCKYFLISALALSVLVGLGLESLKHLASAEMMVKHRVLWVAFPCLVVSLALVAIWVYSPRHPARLEDFIRSHIATDKLQTKDIPQIRTQVVESLRSTSVFLFLGAALAIAATSRRLKVGAQPLLIALLALELMPPNLQLAPLISDADFSFVPRINPYLKSLLGQGVARVQSTTLLDPPPGSRLYAPNRSYAWTTLFKKMSGQPPDGMLMGIQYSVDYSVDGLNTRDSQELYQAWSIFPDQLRISLLEKLNTPVVLALNSIRDPRVELQASFQTSSSLPLRVYRLRECSPRAYFVRGVERVRTHQDALLKFLDPKFPHRETVILEEPGASATSGGTGTADVRITRYENRRVVCSVDAKEAGYLVLLDSYYPGWRAVVDGTRTEILRANYAFRAIPVAAGIHEVVLSYRPLSFYLGLGLSCLAFGAWLIWVIYRFWRWAVPVGEGESNIRSVAG